MGEILRNTKGYRLYAVLAPVMVALEVVMEVLIPYEMAKIIDIGIAQGDMGYVLRTGFYLIIMAFLALIFGAAAGYFASVAAAGCGKNLRQTLFNRIQEFSFHNIDNFHTGGLVTRLTTDINQIQQTYLMCLRQLARTPILIVMAWIMAYRINPKIAMIYLWVAPLVFLVMVILIKLTYPRYLKALNQYDVVSDTISENISGQRVVKAYVREDFESEKFNREAALLSNLSAKAQRLIALNQPAATMVMYAMVLMVVYIGGRSIVDGTMEIGQLNSIIVYAFQIMMSIIMASMILVMFIISMASKKRITQLLEEEIDLVNPENPVMRVENGDIEFENVTFYYSKTAEKPALENINLSIKAGQTIGIVGGTGSAKSTLVNLIPRLYDVTSGSVKVGGIDVRKYDLTTLREAVAVVLQKNTLFTGTIRENVRWGKQNASDDEVKEACQLAQADSFISELPDGYDTLLVEGGKNVSGGQKQRLCIARALIKKPKILILDDSTSAVDTKTDSLIREAFREQIPDTTKLIIAQRISSVEDADQIIVLDKGEINQIGTAEELLKSNSIYREMYEAQQAREGEDE